MIAQASPSGWPRCPWGWRFSRAARSPASGCLGGAGRPRTSGCGRNRPNCLEYGGRPVRSAGSSMKKGLIPCAIAPGSLLFIAGQTGSGVVDQHGGKPLYVFPMTAIHCRSGAKATSCPMNLTCPLRARFALVPPAPAIGQDLQRALRPRGGWPPDRCLPSAAPIYHAISDALGIVRRSRLFKVDLVLSVGDGAKADRPRQRRQPHRAGEEDPVVRVFSRIHQETPASG